MSATARAHAMLNGTTVFLASLGYVGFLFAVAWWGDHGGRRFVIGRHRALVYSLSLAIYCTSWTYYGSVGLASTQGFDFLPIYIGPILVVGLGYRLIGRIGDLSRAQNLTTVADFVSARYGKSQAAAALAALIALTASAPYIALQLKSITQTILMVVDSFEYGRLTPGAPTAAFDLAVTFLLAAFAMAFGTRRIDPTEHQDGLILAISVESVVKLVAFLAVGAFVVWGLFGGLGALFRAGAAEPRIAAVMRAPPDPANWLTTTLLSALAILLLPRQFHVSVVESRGRADIARAAWLFPTYLVAHQPVRRAAGDRRPADLLRRRDRSRPHRAGAAAQRRRACSGADHHARRPVGGDRRWWWSTASRWRSPSPTISSCRSCCAAAPRRATRRRRARSARGCSPCAASPSSAC